MIKLINKSLVTKKINLAQCPCFHLLTKQSDKGSYPEEAALPQSNIRNPKFYNFPYLILPLKTPLFPQNSYFTKLHPVMKNLIKTSNLNYLVTFMLKPENKAETLKMSASELPLIEIQEATPKVEVEAKKKSKGMKLNTDNPMSKELIEKELFEDYHQNVIYDEELSKLEPKFSLTKLSSLDDIHTIGTVCRLTIQSSSDSPNDTLMIIKGIQRVKLVKEIPFKGFSKQLLDYTDYLKFGIVAPLSDIEEPLTASYKNKLSSLLELYANLRTKAPINVPELIFNPLFNPSDPRIIDILCGYLCLTTFFQKSELQRLLEVLSPSQRLNLCYEFLSNYASKLLDEWSELNKTVKSVQGPDNKTKMLEIYNFLKKSRESPFKSPLIEKLLNQFSQRQLPPHIKTLVEDELNQMQEINEQHPDFNNKKNLLELILSLPFGVTTQDTYDLDQASKILEEDHYGIEDVKERILEFIAVSKVRGTTKGKSILLVGPPGVGKTSVASSIARCLNRKFARIALGGEYDVAIIKGHRKTYLGSYPGKIVQALKNVQTENPVILLDEVDKIGRSLRGNIQDALLEVLDPVQNNKFYDNYLEVPLDLSKVLFICSANLLESIHPALLDRMEVIEISGYTQQEKFHIVNKHLLPKALKAIGLEEGRISFSSETIEKLINGYARESGLRNIERLIKRILEKTGLKIVMGQNVSNEIKPDQLVDFVGLPVFSEKRLYEGPPPPGIVIGLAYNAYGGSILFM